ncbi:MAG TPA: hypothetical protein VLQ45_28030 [Thermoanaerobaculia bacterium]|nr:hypothetical protein [Thermoanaerobaculia bacterium]
MLLFKGLLEDLLQGVDPQDLRSYALAKGWQQAGNLDGRFSVLSYPGSDLDQVLVPLNVYAPDYGRRIGDAVQVLSEWESRPALEILKDLLPLPSDSVTPSAVTFRREHFPAIEGRRRSKASP